MAAVQGQQKKCVCSERMLKLEDAVKELDSRLNVVEDCLLGMDNLRGRMFQLEKSMENALDRIMPRLDALLAGLPASATSQIAAKPSIFPPFPPYPNPNPAPATNQAAAPSPASNGTSKPSARIKPVNICSTCPGCQAKTMCSCAKLTVQAESSSNAAAPSSTGTPPAAGKPAAKASVGEKSLPVDKMAAVADMAPMASYIFEELEKQLREAAARGDVVMCQKIMMRGVDSKKRDSVTGDTALHCAARGGHLGCIMLLLAVAKNTVISTNKQRQTPLMVAAACGHVAAVQLLLHQGRSCLSSRQGGSKALRQVVTDKRDDVLQALLEGGVSANQEENSAGPGPLQIAASSGHLPSLRLLLEHGADLAHSSNDGQTALHKAAMNGHSECVAALLASGANPLDKDASGWEPLHLAARSGHIECVKLLLASGVDVNRPAANGQTPLVCATNECPEVEEVLRAAGAAAEPTDESS